MKKLFLALTFLFVSTIAYADIATSYNQIIAEQSSIEYNVAESYETVDGNNEPISAIRYYPFRITTAGCVTTPEGAQRHIAVREFVGTPQAATFTDNEIYVLLGDSLSGLRSSFQQFVLQALGNNVAL